MHNLVRAINTPLKGRIFSPYLSQVPIVVNVLCFHSSKNFKVHKRLSKKYSLLNSPISSTQKVKNQVHDETSHKAIPSLKSKKFQRIYQKENNSEIIQSNVIASFIQKLVPKSSIKKSKTVLKKIKMNSTNTQSNDCNEIKRGEYATKEEQEIIEPEYKAKSTDKVGDGTKKYNRMKYPTTSQRRTTNISLHSNGEMPKSVKLAAITKSRHDIEYKLKKLAEKYGRRKTVEKIKFEPLKEKQVRKKEDENNIQKILLNEKRKRMALEITRQVLLSQTNLKKKTIMNVKNSKITQSANEKRSVKITLVNSVKKETSKEGLKQINPQETIQQNESRKMPLSDSNEFNSLSTKVNSNVQKFEQNQEAQPSHEKSSLKIHLEGRINEETSKDGQNKINPQDSVQPYQSKNKPLLASDEYNALITKVTLNVQKFDINEEAQSNIHTREKKTIMDEKHSKITQNAHEKCLLKIDLNKSIEKEAPNESLGRINPQDSALQQESQKIPSSELNEYNSLTTKLNLRTQKIDENQGVQLNSATREEKPVINVRNSKITQNTHEKCSLKIDLDKSIEKDITKESLKKINPQDSVLQNESRKMPLSEPNEFNSLSTKVNSNVQKCEQNQEAQPNIANREEKPLINVSVIKNANEKCSRKINLDRNIKKEMSKEGLKLINPSETVQQNESRKMPLSESNKYDSLSIKVNANAQKFERNLEAQLNGATSRGKTILNARNSIIAQNATENCLLKSNLAHSIKEKPREDLKQINLQDSVPQDESQKKPLLKTNERNPISTKKNLNLQKFDNNQEAQINIVEMKEKTIMNVRCSKITHYAHEKCSSRTNLDRIKNGTPKEQLKKFNPEETVQQNESQKIPLSKSNFLSTKVNLNIQKFARNQEACSNICSIIKEINQNQKNDSLVLVIEGDTPKEALTSDKNKESIEVISENEFSKKQEESLSEILKPIHSNVITDNEINKLLYELGPVDEGIDTTLSPKEKSDIKSFQGSSQSIEQLNLINEIMANLKLTPGNIIEPHSCCLFLCFKEKNLTHMTTCEEERMPNQETLKVSYTATTKQKKNFNEIKSEKNKFRPQKTKLGKNKKGTSQKFIKNDINKNQSILQKKYTAINKKGNRQKTTKESDGKKILRVKCPLLLTSKNMDRGTLNFFHFIMNNLQNQNLFLLNKCAKDSLKTSSDYQRRELSCFGDGITETEDLSEFQKKCSKDIITNFNYLWNILQKKSASEQEYILRCFSNDSSLLNVLIPGFNIDNNSAAIVKYLRKLIGVEMPINMSVYLMTQMKTSMLAEENEDTECQMGRDNSLENTNFPTETQSNNADSYNFPTVSSEQVELRAASSGSSPDIFDHARNPTRFEQNTIALVPHRSSRPNTEKELQKFDNTALKEVLLNNTNELNNSNNHSNLSDKERHTTITVCNKMSCDMSNILKRGDINRRVLENKNLNNTSFSNENVTNEDFDSFKKIIDEIKTNVECENYHLKNKLFSQKTDTKAGQENNPSTKNQCMNYSTINRHQKEVQRSISTTNEQCTRKESENDTIEKYIRKIQERALRRAHMDMNEMENSSEAHNTKTKFPFISNKSSIYSFPECSNNPSGHINENLRGQSIEQALPNQIKINNVTNKPCDEGPQNKGHSCNYVRSHINEELKEINIEQALSKEKKESKYKHEGNNSQIPKGLEIYYAAKTNNNFKKEVLENMGEIQTGGSNHNRIQKEHKVDFNNRSNDYMNTNVHRKESSELTSNVSPTRVVYGKVIDENKINFTDKAVKTNKYKIIDDLSNVLNKKKFTFKDVAEVIKGDSNKNKESPNFEGLKKMFEMKTSSAKQALSTTMIHDRRDQVLKENSVQISDFNARKSPISLMEMTVKNMSNRPTRTQNSTARQEMLKNHKNRQVHKSPDDSAPKWIVKGNIRQQRSEGTDETRAVGEQDHYANTMAKYYKQCAALKRVQKKVHKRPKLNEIKLTNLEHLVNEDFNRIVKRINLMRNLKDLTKKSKTPLDFANLLKAKRKRQTRSRMEKDKYKKEHGALSCQKFDENINQPLIEHKVQSNAQQPVKNLQIPKEVSSDSDNLKQLHAMREELLVKSEPKHNKDSVNTQKEKQTSIKQIKPLNGREILIVRDKSVLKIIGTPDISMKGLVNEKNNQAKENLTEKSRKIDIPKDKMLINMKDNTIGALGHSIDSVRTLKAQPTVSDDMRSTNKWKDAVNGNELEQILKEQDKGLCDTEVLADKEKKQNKLTTEFDEEKKHLSTIIGKGSTKLENSTRNAQNEILRDPEYLRKHNLRREDDLTITKKLNEKSNLEENNSSLEIAKRMSGQSDSMETYQILSFKEKNYPQKITQEDTKQSISGQNDSIKFHQASSLKDEYPVKFKEEGKTSRQTDLIKFHQTPKPKEENSISEITQETTERPLSEQTDSLSSQISSAKEVYPSKIKQDPTNNLHTDENDITPSSLRSATAQRVLEELAIEKQWRERLMENISKNKSIEKSLNKIDDHAQGKLAIINSQQETKIESIWNQPSKLSTTNNKDSTSNQNIRISLQEEKNIQQKESTEKIKNKENFEQTGQRKKESLHIVPRQLRNEDTTQAMKHKISQYRMRNLTKDQEVKFGESNKQKNISNTTLQHKNMKRGIELSSKYNESMTKGNTKRNIVSPQPRRDLIKIQSQGSEQILNNTTGDVRANEWDVSRKKSKTLEVFETYISSQNSKFKPEVSYPNAKPRSAISPLSILPLDKVQIMEKRDKKNISPTIFGTHRIDINEPERNLDSKECKYKKSVSQEKEGFSKATANRYEQENRRGDHEYNPIAGSVMSNVKSQLQRIPSSMSRLMTHQTQNPSRDMPNRNKLRKFEQNHESDSEDLMMDTCLSGNSFRQLCNIEEGNERRISPRYNYNRTRKVPQVKFGIRKQKLKNSGKNRLNDLHTIKTMLSSSEKRSHYMSYSELLNKLYVRQANSQ